MVFGGHCAENKLFTGFCGVFLVMQKTKLGKWYHAARNGMFKERLNGIGMQTK